MTHFLALDVGRKHTGVAYADSSLGVPVALETIHHEDAWALIDAVTSLVHARKIDTLILGLPLLLSGTEASEAAHVRDIGKRLGEACHPCEIEYLDERLTTKASRGERGAEDHARAALDLLTVHLERHRA